MKNTSIYFIAVLCAMLTSSCKQQSNSIDSEIEALANEPIFTEVENIPEFDGGMTALYSYVANNIKYPEQAIIKGIEGKVFVEFVISKDGSIQNTRVLRGIHPDCDNEAVRVISQMPAWAPGKHKDQPVNVKMVLPITFKLK